MKLYPVLIIFFSFIPLLTTAQEANILSLKSIGGNGSDQVAQNIVATTDGGFIITIGTNSEHGLGNIDTFSVCTTSGNSSTTFIKYNSDASVVEWSKCYDQNGDSALGYIFPTNSGRFVLGGMYNSAAGGGFIICKEDELGNTIWNKSYSKGNSARLISMIATSDNGYLMIGESYYIDTNVLVHYGVWSDADLWLLKLDSNGNKVWSRVIGGSGYESPRSIIEIPSGGYYIVGATESDDYDCIGNHGDYDLYVARLNNEGNIIWHNDIGGTGADGGKSAIPDGRGGILILGNTNSVDGDITHPTGYGGGYWLIDLDSNNHIVRNNCYGGAYCQPNTICKAKDGSIWLTGWSWHTGLYLDTTYGNYDAWIVHADSVSNFISAKVLGSTWQDIGTMLHPLSNGNVLLGGSYSSNDNSFASLNYYGATDIFLAVFTPWTTDVPAIAIGRNSVNIYPNPAGKAIRIKLAGEEGAINIANNLGKTIYNKKIQNGKYVDIDISEWATGVYLVRWQGEGITLTNKFIKA